MHAAALTAATPTALEALRPASGAVEAAGAAPRRAVLLTDGATGDCMLTAKAAMIEELNRTDRYCACSQIGSQPTAKIEKA